MSVGRFDILRWALGWKHTAAVSPVADSQTISSSVGMTGTTGLTKGMESVTGLTKGQTSLTVTVGLQE